MEKIIDKETVAKRVKEAIEHRGMNKTVVADRANINRVTLYNRLDGIGEFTVSEMLGLKRALRLSLFEFNYIFFDFEVEKSATKEAL